jgi:hypothetical protein
MSVMFVGGGSFGNEIYRHTIGHILMVNFKNAVSINKRGYTYTLCEFINIILYIFLYLFIFLCQVTYNVGVEA